ncbi:hypothetical protein VTJ04DRAFT_7107 [Mycothermus thermophilus]|uniref:uncharacterized protein n=1 Tax=Humicola insolens TaxID=85995 RepID=UPI0037427C08
MDGQTQRRIELQAPEDLTYLIDNVRRAAADSINAAFPPVDDGGLDGQEDELRNRIEELVNDYILQTFTLALPNLSINGLPVTNITPYLPPGFQTSSSSSQKHPQQQLDEPQVQYEYEPFDPRKRDRVEQLVSEEEDLLRSIAALKRKAPANTSRKWIDGSTASLQADDELLAAIEQKLSREGEAAGKRGLEGMGPLERQAEVEGRFKAAVEGLGRLKKEMPAAVAKMERARGAAGPFHPRPTYLCRAQQSAQRPDSSVPSIRPIHPSIPHLVDKFERKEKPERKKK